MLTHPDDVQKRILYVPCCNTKQAPVASLRDLKGQLENAVPKMVPRDSRRRRPPRGRWCMWAICYMPIWHTNDKKKHVSVFLEWRKVLSMRLALQMCRSPVRHTIRRLGFFSHAPPSRMRLVRMADRHDGAHLAHSVQRSSTLGFEACSKCLFSWP